MGRESQKQGESLQKNGKCNEEEMPVIVAEGARGTRDEWIVILGLPASPFLKPQHLHSTIVTQHNERYGQYGK